MDKGNSAQVKPTSPPTPAANAAAAAPPVESTPMPIAVPPQPMPVQPQPMSMENGGFAGDGGGGGGIRGFFNDVNLVDIAVSAFIVAGVLYSIHYFKFMMMLEKTGYSDLSSRMGKLESAMTAQQAEFKAMNGGNGVKKKPLMRIG